MSLLHVQRLADGPGRPLVCSHALGLDHQMWRGLARAFDGQRPVWAYDHRGHGRSAAPPGPWTLDDMAEDAQSMVQGLIEADPHHRAPVWLGLSMGGMVGQHLLARAPALLAGAVLAHTVPGYDDAARAAWATRIEAVRAAGMGAVVQTVVERYLSAAFRTDRPMQASELRDQLLQNNAHAYMLACQAVAGFGPVVGLEATRLPVLVISGQLDVGAPPQAGEALAQRIPGARFQVLDHCAHLSPVEQPSAFLAEVQALLDAHQL